MSNAIDRGLQFLGASCPVDPARVYNWTMLPVKELGGLLARKNLRLTGFNYIRPNDPPIDYIEEIYYKFEGNRRVPTDIAVRTHHRGDNYAVERGFPRLIVEKICPHCGGGLPIKGE